MSRSAAPGRRPRSSTTRATGAASIRRRISAGYAGILQADAYDGYNKLYLADRKPKPDPGGRVLGAMHGASSSFSPSRGEHAPQGRERREIPLSPIAI